MATKSRSKHQEGLYKSYQASKRQETNRKRKLTKLAKEQPNNEQIAAALKNIKYRRGTPKARHWSKTSKHFAQLLKSFAKRQSGFSVPSVSSKDMGKLSARAHDEHGALVWNQS
jgi:hypothetical protein